MGSCLSVLPLGITWAAERPAAATGEVLKYTEPTGESFVAIGLRAKDLPEVKATRHHVVLMDTSASQFGEHRTQGFAVLQAFLRGLPNEDRVSLFAIDVQATRLTTDFVAPNSDAVRDAITTLQQRAPLQRLESRRQRCSRGWPTAREGGDRVCLLSGTTRCRGFGNETRQHATTAVASRS
ncbi:MAG: Uncharacterized protein FD138_3456 [Planctomycetota bacterium]|nr:MAG: Uncharacterized protein FD138_3456 [Planctomycetota bacterium]